MIERMEEVIDDHLVMFFIVGLIVCFKLPWIFIPLMLMYFISKLK